MTNTLQALAVTLTLVASIVAATGSALAGDAYHWGYPDSFKDHPNVPLHSLGVGSGIPSQYR
jgi:hypothetical protein